MICDGSCAMQAAQDEALGCPGPAQLLRELIFYTQFHDPEESAPASDDNWEFGVPDDDFQVRAPALSLLRCERALTVLGVRAAQAPVLHAWCRGGARHHR